MDEKIGKSLVRSIYTIIFYLLLPLVFLRLYRRGAKNPGYRKGWRQRLGYVPWHLNHCIWLHAVSLGESIAAAPVIQHLLERYPDVSLVVTNMTPTGRDFITTKFNKQLYHCYIPYDIPRLLKRFMRRVNPCALLLMETELWPNVQAICKQRDIPVLLANARLSNRSCKKYQRFPKMTQQMLQAIHYIAAQYETDAQNFMKLGVPKDVIRVTGNIKFDTTLPADLPAKAKLIQSQWTDRPVWIAASTHEGEDEVMLQAHQALLKDIPNALLILVPRHPERFDKVAQLAQQQFKTVTRSSGQQCDDTIQIYIGDTMGEMLALYASAQIAFVGGSLAATGGHNILEPAALGLPILTGPHMENFAKIAELFTRAGACVVVRDADTLATTLLDLFHDDKKRQQLAQAGFAIMEQNRGALKRLNTCIDKLLEEEADVGNKTN